MGRTPLPEWTKHISNNNQSNSFITALEILDDDKLDREWIVRNVLGGMSAGFGLRGAYLYSYILYLGLFCFVVG